MNIDIRVTRNTVVPGKDKFDLTYDPSTVHVLRARTQVTFTLAAGPIAQALVVFDVPVDGPEFYLDLTAGAPSKPVTFDASGIYHYRFISAGGPQAARGPVVFDVWCPSIIVH